MKHILKFMLVLVSLTTIVDIYAQKSDDVEKQVNELVKAADLSCSRWRSRMSSALCQILS